MPVRFTLQRKRNPQKPKEVGKWYAVFKSSNPIKGKTMTRMATEGGTVEDYELGASSGVIAKWVHRQLIQGNRAYIEGLGTFRVTFGSEGVERVKDFHTGLIRNIKISFIPDPDLRADVLRDISFENDGVMDGETYYGSIENYLKVTGEDGSASTGGGTTTTTPGGGEDTDGEEDSNNPLA